MSSATGSKGKRLPFFYGWIIVAVTFVTMAIGVNARTAFSLFFPPILSEFGWERGVTAGAFSFGFVVSGRGQPADRPTDGSRRSARGDGARRRPDGRRPVAGAADDAAMASLSHHRRHGRRRQRLPRLFRTIAVPAELVHPPPRPRDGNCVRRRRHRLGHPAAVGAAHDRADRLAHRLHRDGHYGSWSCWRRSISCCASVPRISGSSPTATLRPRRRRQSRSPTSSIRSGPATDWTLRSRPSHLAVLVDRARLFLRPVHLVRRAGAPDQVSARHRLQPERRRLGARRRSACSAFPARSCSDMFPTGSGANGSGRQAAPALRSAFAALIALKYAAVTAAGLSHGASPRARSATA